MYTRVRSIEWGEFRMNETLVLEILALRWVTFRKSRYELGFPLLWG
jgi:hypothetical protein